ncbi:hypothetical protein JCM1840_007082 [Sporobolomyces johnsonii]
MPPASTPNNGKSRAAPYNKDRADSATADEGAPGDSGGDSSKGQGGKRPRTVTNDGRRHLSCENCRIRKMKCSRQAPCLSCRMRGDECIWVGPAPNGSADEDELESSQTEVNRLKKLVDLLLARLEEQDAEVTGYLPPVQQQMTYAGPPPPHPHQMYPSAYSHRQPPPGYPPQQHPFPDTGSPLSEPRGMPSISHGGGDVAVHSAHPGYGPSGGYGYSTDPYYGGYNGYRTSMYGGGGPSREGWGAYGAPGGPSGGQGANGKEQ